MAQDETNYQWFEKTHGADPTTQWQLEDARKKGIFGGLPQWLQDMIGANATKYGLDFGHLVGTGGAWPILGPNGYYQPGGDPGPTPPATTSASSPLASALSPTAPGYVGGAPQPGQTVPGLSSLSVPSAAAGRPASQGTSAGGFAGLAALAGALGGAQSKKRKPGIGQYL